MKKLLGILILSIHHYYSYTQSTSLTETQAIKIVTSQDSLMWHGFNICNADLSASVMADDLEFYHDQGGITLGKDAFRKSIADNICGSTTLKVRREMIPGSIRFHLLRAENKIYGVIHEGQHYFYNARNGNAEKLEGIARFTHLWLKDGDTWKLKRVLSFDHKSIGHD